METALTTQETNDPFAFLSIKEREAYDVFLGTGKPHLRPEVSGTLFEHFLNGKTCLEIQHENLGYSFGSIVCARVEYGWDLARKDHYERLMASASDKAMRLQLEAVEFVFELFQITHLVNREKFKRYMQTKSPEDLRGAIQIDTPKQYRDLINAMLLLSGRPTQVHKTEGEHHHLHETAGGTPPIPVPGMQSGDFLTQQAARVREEQARELQARNQSEAKRMAKKPFTKVAKPEPEGDEE